MTAGRYRIGAVAAMTGISSHALRAWERRYQVSPSGRSPGGTRLYSDEDVDRLRLIKKLLDAGHSIGGVFDLSRDELARLAGDVAPAARAEPLEALRAKILAAVDHLDLSTAERLIGHASLTLDPPRLIHGVIVPTLRTVGERWQVGELHVSQEHAATALLRNVLGSMLRAGTRETTGPIVLFTTPAGELHELGALSAALLASTMGCRVLYLGPSLPADEILFAVRRARADALALSILCAGNDRTADELAIVAAGLSPRVALLAGGDGARHHVEALGRRARILADLTELEAELRALDAEA